MSSAASTPPLTPATSRSASPFEIQHARRIQVEDPYGGIEMVHLSPAVIDAFEGARNTVAAPSRSPSPGPSIAPSMASRVEGSRPSISRVPSAYSIDNNSTAPMFPELQVVEDEPPGSMHRTCSLCMPIAMATIIVAIAASLGWYVYNKFHHNS